MNLKSGGSKRGASARLYTRKAFFTSQVTSSFLPFAIVVLGLLASQACCESYCSEGTQCERADLAFFGLAFRFDGWFLQVTLF